MTMYNLVLMQSEKREVPTSHAQNVSSLDLNASLFFIWQRDKGTLRLHWIIKALRKIKPTHARRFKTSSRHHHLWQRLVVHHILWLEVWVQSKMAGTSHQHGTHFLPLSFSLLFHRKRPYTRGFPLSTVHVEPRLNNAPSTPISRRIKQSLVYPSRPTLRWIVLTYTRCDLENNP